ncbi:MAG: PEP/pyruvate-binding domain-containing protein, partial [Anaerolineae bacterium]
GKGVIRLVFGLGTRAVDRVGSDYPRMIPVSHPHLRPEIGVAIAKYAQRYVDVIDLQENAYATLPFGELVNGASYANLHLLVSELRDGGIYDPVKRISQRGAGEDLVVTFNNLLRQTDFAALMERILARLEEAYGRPVDVEFTASIGDDRRVKINLLQCRPMNIPGMDRSVLLPDDIVPDRILFRSGRFIGGGAVDRLRYLVYIDPERYMKIPSLEAKRAMRSVIGKINAHLRETGERMVLLGPGRFGSSNINLGVNVRYADIDSAAVLVELGKAGADHTPEVSYGTHFFQDLVESQMLYLAVSTDAGGDPDSEGSMLNHEFFAGSTNSLGDLVPGARSFESLIKVIDVSKIHQDQTVSVVADPHSQRAVCFLASGDD